MDAYGKRQEMVRTTILKWACTILAIVAGISVQAQRVPFFNINIENGLVQSQATCLVQDKTGYLWIGTIGGLSRYDGKNLYNYTARDGLNGNEVKSLAPDNKGNLWIGGSQGLCRFDGKNFQQFTFQSQDNPNGNNVTAISIAPDGTIWCIAGNKVYSIINGKSRLLELPEPDAIATSIHAGKDGLWVNIIFGKLLHFDGKKWHLLLYPERADGRKLFSRQLFEDSRHHLWLLTNGGLYRVQDSTIVLHHLGKRPMDDLPTLTAMTEDRQHNYWLTTGSGVIRISDSSLFYYNKKNGLSDNAFFDAVTDAEGNVWLASDGQGIFRFSGALFTALDESMGLPSGQIMSIAASKSGQLFLGTYDAGLYTSYNNNVAPLLFPDNNKLPVTAMTVRKGYEIWIGTKGSGLWRYDYRGFKSVTGMKNAPLNNVITALYTDRRERIWIGQENYVAIYDGDSIRRIPLKARSIEAFIQTGQDSVLIATSKGINIFSADSIRPFVTNAAPDSSFPQCFALRGRELWIGTSDNGIIVWNLDRHTSAVFNKSNGLRSDFIYNIICDNEGNIWAGTGYGIQKISFINGSPVIYHYGKGQGVNGMESNHNAVFKMPDGSIWFGTTNGALHYQPKSTTVKPQPISIVMDAVKLFGESLIDTNYYDSTDKWYNVPYHLRLPYKKNNITFGFHAISLSSGEQLRYRYRIDGLDAPWSDWSSTTSVTYSALPPGKYVFRVECATDNKTYKSLNYPFEIITPFHKTNWFRLVILAGCILLGISLQYIANKRKQNRLRLLEQLRREEQNKVRQRTAEDFHDEVGNKLTRINVLTNVLKSKIGDLTPDTKRIIDQIQDNTAQLYSGTRDILWSLKPSNDNLYEILHRTRDFGTDLFQDTEVEFTFTGTDDQWKDSRLPLDVSRNLIMIFKEAMNNCLKYSGATQVKLSVTLLQKDVLQLVLSDNGKGFDILRAKKGHGIDNMNVRAKRINGILYIDSRQDHGTIITLTFKIPSMA